MYHCFFSKDEDVRVERNRIANLSPNDYANEAVVLKNITKVYPSNGMMAVDHLSLGVPKKECFGLLGVNGLYSLKLFYYLVGVLWYCLSNLALSKQMIV